MVTHETVLEIREVVQKIIIPIVFVVGLIGNSITVIVLTRKSMRCSTNVYLTALAVTDMLYLTTTFLLTLQHYQSFHLYHPLYWRCFGLIIWFHDGLSYISIYIATCFTIERFIAVRYPIRRQQFCTEELAKKVIVVISIFCVALTVSTAFEHAIDVKENSFNSKTNEPCPPAVYNTSQDNLLNNTLRAEVFDNQDDEDDFVARALPTAFDNELLKSPITTIPTNTLERSNVNENLTCIDYYSHAHSALGLNDQYYTIFFHFTTLVFVIIPLAILITFNTFLIILVRKSRTLRTEMTNMSIRASKKPSSKSLSAAKTSKVSQENKITIVLIAVVILFIVCQLPWAIYLICENYMEIDHNLKLFLGNIFNLLVDINSAMNFFLYCVLSDKYRKTVKDLINGIRHHHNRHHQDGLQSEFTRQGTLTTSWNRHSSRYTFNHRPNSLRKDFLNKKSKESGTSFPMQLLNKQLNRLDNTTHSNVTHEYIPLKEDINPIINTISSTQTTIGSTITATTTSTTTGPSTITNSNSTNSLLSMKYNQYNNQQQQQQQQQHPYQQQKQQLQHQQQNEFSYPLNNNNRINNNFFIQQQQQPGTSGNNNNNNNTGNIAIIATSPSTTSSSYNIYNTYSNSCNNSNNRNNNNNNTINWNNLDNQQIKTNQLLLLQHQQQRQQQQQPNIQNQNSQQQKHNLIDPKKQQQHTNINCPYYLNKMWTRPSQQNKQQQQQQLQQTPNLMFMMNSDDYDYNDDQQKQQQYRNHHHQQHHHHYYPHHSHQQQQQQQQHQQQQLQQRRRSLSLTSLPKIKHAPSCKDFPDDL